MRRPTDRRDPTRRARRTISFGVRTYRERRLGEMLDREVSPIGAVFHGCRLPDDTYRVDHVVVGPTGLWLVIADHQPGLVRLRGRGDRRRLTVDGVDQAARLGEVSAVADRFVAFLRSIELDWLDMSVTLCFANAKPSRRSRSARVSGVQVSWARSLVDRIASPGPLSSAEADRVAATLRRLLVIDGDRRRRS